jgi:hypothetical protein
MEAEKGIKIVLLNVCRFNDHEKWREKWEKD